MRVIRGLNHSLIPVTATLAVAFSLPARAIAEDAAEPPQAARTFDDVKDELNEMVQEERDSMKRSREMVAKISRLGVRETKVRNQLLRTDPELRALKKLIGEKQEELERLVREKSEVLASMIDKKQALMDEHGKLQASINDLRERRTALFNDVKPRTGGVQPETRSKE